VARLEAIASEATTVAGLIAQERRTSRWGALWIGLTLASLIVLGLSLASLWPPRALSDSADHGMQAE